MALACELAQQTAGELTLLHVIETIAGEDEPDEETQRFYARLEGEARQRLDEATKGLAAGPFARRSEIVFGSRARAIVDYAQEHGNDLILLSSRRVDTERPGPDWISISHRVAILAPCPVLLVK
jgi:nucleotide-binding universal stress UspA family protein